MSDSNRNNIRVVCRFRPQNSREIREGGVPIINYDDNGDSCRMEGKEFQGNFTFDKIFPPETQQKSFFDESIKPIVDDVIGGYNGTVFAYGQTGSGKTHTMMGDMDNEEFKGLIPRIVEQIFHSIIDSPSTMEYTVKVSYMEIYMEKIRDLLNRFKLTRILQESLGGNSRTTLIINCSPSSFNEAETLSTLRFGMRAKSIKNKARVNAELSPAELKALLKKAKNEAVSFQQYISALEGEVGVWRSGGTVPKEKWASMDKAGSTSTQPPTPTTPSNPAIEAAKKEADSRPGTPAPILEKDEREEFLKRENELTDQIADKESVLAAQEKMLSELKEELDSYKSQEEENKKMESELNELKVQLEKVAYENKEGAITMDSLRESNLELSAEVDSLKKQLSEHRLSQKEGDKEQKKQEKMAAMLAELDPSGVISKKEQQIRDTLLKLETIGDNSSPLTMEELSTLRRELSDSKTLVTQHEQTINELHYENEHLTRKRDELEIRLTTLELEYEELLDKTIAEEEANNNIDITETIAELRGKLEAQFVAKKEVQQKEIDELKQELEKKNEELHKLNSALAELKKVNEDLQNAISDKESKTEGQKNVADKEKDMERIRKTMAQQLADFDVMKKALMRDLQNRCEKVVELEISLDETREQYNNVLRNSNNKAQQKKMAFLERNLEQLTNVQKQLVEQNSSLKKEVAIAERKLLARNERIQALEALLQDAQEKLTTQNQKFEAQLQAVRERLEQARSQKSSIASGLGFGRIAKPLRGGVPVTAERK
ncbi:hypothetical protein RhiirA4_392002 [Rhizophagus irregularis]|uniref:Kinesin motor domain-containing protein n=1 Tax=Rhizophagus irregularis TaxID=588596 RepID=A0A2I1FVL9_9GLOM|nr:hypothetical protein RhiirA4_392002 [Rhizophagus irregularis]